MNIHQHLEELSVFRVLGPISPAVFGGGSLYLGYVSIMFISGADKHYKTFGAIWSSVSTVWGYIVMDNKLSHFMDFRYSVSQEIISLTSQLSRWSGRLYRWSGRSGFLLLRKEIGRANVGKFASGLATGGLIFEGFYDWGVIGEAAWDATSFDDCGCQDD